MRIFSMFTFAQQTAPAVADTSFVATAWDMVVRGGWFMIPIAMCSLVAMTIVVERLIVTGQSRIVPRSLLEALTALRHQPRQALAKCAADPSPLAAVILAAVKARGLTRELQEKAVSDAGEREVRKLRHRMRLLSSLPQVATMLGLLGTVLGMIRTFTVVAASADSLGKTERLAQGIHEAWTATAGGLIIAIPTLLAYHIIMGRIDAGVSALDNAAKLWLDADVADSATARVDEAVISTSSVAATGPGPVIPVQPELAGSAT